MEVGPLDLGIVRIVVDATARIRIGGKGLGRFTWLKTFARAEITSRPSRS